MLKNRLVQSVARQRAVPIAVSPTEFLSYPYGRPIAVVEPPRISQLPAIIRQKATMVPAVVSKSGIITRHARYAHPVALQRANPAVYYAGKYNVQSFSGFSGIFQSLQDQSARVLANAGGPNFVGKPYSNALQKQINAELGARGLLKGPNLIEKTGHAIGKAVTSGVGKAVIGTALAVTGVGIPAAAAIGAGTQAAGRLIAPGGNIGKAAKEGAIGAVGGAAAGGVGKLISNVGVVQSIRRRIGTAKPPTYQSDERIDALASGKLPDVGVTPDLARADTSQTILRKLPDSVASDITQTGVDAARSRGARIVRSGVSEAIGLERKAGEAIAAANKETVASKAAELRAQAQEFLRKAAEIKAKAEAAAQIATGIIAPSSNTVSPQGGFPVSSDSYPSTSTVVPEAGQPEVMQAGMLGGINPMVLLAAGAAFFFLSDRRR